MTVIAYRDGVMASDTKVSADGQFTFNVVKIVANSKGDLAGAGGNIGHAAQFLQWFLKGETGPPPSTICDTPNEDSYHSLIIRKDEKNNAVTVDGIELVPIYGLYFSIGSGRDQAMAAMAAGAGAVDAVKIACELNNSSGGDIVVLHHDGSEKVLTRKITWDGHSV